MMYRHVGYLGIALFGLVLCSTTIFARQEPGVLPAGYPARPIRVLLGVTAGGGLDAVTRAVSQKLSERLGQSVIVDNRPGASSTIAMSLTASATPDGYTLMGATKTMILNGATKKVPYDVLKAYVPISAMSTQVYVMLVNPSIPVKSIYELISYAKARPGVLNYGTAGIGSLQHVGMELFNLMAGTKIVHVPYKGGGAAIIDLVGGQIQVMPSVTISVGAHIRSGKLRAIAVTGSQRVQILPDVPTVSESGVKGFELINMYGLFAPAGTAPVIVSAINRQIGLILGHPDLKNTFAADGVEAAEPITPEQFKSIVAQELNKWSAFIRESKITF